jgi:hypothetical protein
MTAEATYCAALDEKHGLLPGTTAMRHLNHDVRFRQGGPLGWRAEPSNTIDIIDVAGIRWALEGLGSTPAEAMADLWEKASKRLLEVNPPGGREPFRVRWDAERGWSVP